MYQGLVVAYLSRAGRSTRHLLEMWDRIETVGGTVVAVAENLDTSTPGGRLTRTMLAAIAEHELDLYRDRFEEQCQSATARGVWQRRQTPTGYTRDPATRRLVPDGRARVVRAVFAARVQGAAMVDVADMLQMTPSGARQLLRNRVYLGELRVRSYVNLAAHEALVSADLFDDVQQVAAARRPRSGLTGPALLAGLIRCAGCGHVMSRTNTRALVYGCGVRHSAGRCPSPTAITVSSVDEHVTAVALSHLERIRVEASTRDDGVQAARLAVSEAKREVSAYLAGVKAAGLPAGVYVDGLQARQGVVQERERQLADVRGAVPSLPTGDIQAAWTGWDERQRNHVLRGLLDGVLVAAAGRGRRVQVADRVRVLARGSGLLPGIVRGGVAMPVQSIVLPDGGGDGVLGVLG